VQFSSPIRRALLISAFGPIASIVIVCLRLAFLRWSDDPDMPLLAINFAVAWLPFALSFLLAFVPDMRKAHPAWRLSVVLAGLCYSVLLWKQQNLAIVQSRKDQSTAINTAVQQSNQHSDERIGEVRNDVAKVNTAVQDAIAKSESALSADIGKVKIPLKEKATFESSFWPASLTDWPIHERAFPKVSGNVTFAFSIQIKGHMAKQTTIWLRLCRGCKYAKGPAGFRNISDHPGEDEDPHERTLSIGDFLPNIAYMPISVEVIPPPNEPSFAVGVMVGCENCDPVDANKFQILRVDIQP
jgi:hypothetical protein